MMKAGEKCINKGKHIVQYWTAPEAGERLFLCIWILVLVRETLATTMFPMLGVFYNLVSLLMVGGVALKIICCDSYHLSELVAIVFLGAAALLVVVCSGYQEPLFWTILLVGAKDVSFRKILKVYLVVSAAIVGLAFVASLLGVIVNLRYETDNRGIRNSFGIIYPTDFAAHIFFLMAICFYLMGNRIKGWQYGVSLILAALVYIFCKTRLDAICMFFIVVFYMWINKKRQVGGTKKNNYRAEGIIREFAVLGMPLSALFMALLTVLCNPDNMVWKTINDVMSSRLMQGQKGLAEYGIRLFGQQVPMRGNGGSTILPKGYFFVDCSYLYILLKYGIVFLVIVLVVYILCCKKYKDDKHFLLMIALVSLNCMIAHHLVELAYCPFAMALFARKDCQTGEVARLKRFGRKRKAENSHG